MLRFALLALLLIAAPAALAQHVPEAMSGRADIRHHDLLVCDTDSATPPPPADPSCRPTRMSEVDPQGRQIWLLSSVRIDNPGAFSATPLAIFSGALAARDIWFNGQRVGAVGVSGATANAETPGDLDNVMMLPPELVHPGENLLAMRLSSFHNVVRVNTPVHYAFIRPIAPVDRQLLKYYGATLATAGALIVAALFFGFVFIANPRNRDPLLIAVMAICAIGQLFLESLRGFTDIPYPMQIWRLTGIAILAFGFAVSMTAYAARRFAPRRWRTYVAVAAALSLLAAPFAPGFDGITAFALLLPALVSMVAAIQGVRARRVGAIAALTGLVVFAALILLQRELFLDQTFYLAVAAVALVLFVDQALALKRARDTAAEASRRAATLELELLRRRIAPHFLMNTLNALTEWVESDPKTGVKMIEALAGEFRLLSQICDRSLIPLADEIALCRRHLEVMSYRVDRAFTLDSEGVNENLEVPPGVLHTLVENAFTHGRFVDGGVFRLRQSGDKEITLTLTAPPAEARAPQTTGGEGMSYVRGRLEAAFGTSARADTGPTPEGWRTILTLPRPLPS